MIKYVDDFVIASKAEADKTDTDVHIEAIDSYFQCLARSNLKIKLSKCQFFVE